MITYSDLYEALRKEKYNDKLQKLPKNFLKELNIYFKEKKAMSEKDDDMFTEDIKKARKQVDNAHGVLRELMNLRYRKILTLALIAAQTGIDKRDAENMLEDEKELLSTITKKLGECEKKINSALNGLSEEKDLKNTLVKFNSDVPQFSGADSETLGPFKQGDVANLPIPVASILVESGQAELIEQE